MSGDADLAVLVDHGLRLDGADLDAPALRACAKQLVDVGDLEDDVNDTVAVPGVVGDKITVGRDRACQPRLDQARLDHVRLRRGVSVLQARPGDQLHPPRQGMASSSASGRRLRPRGRSRPPTQVTGNRCA